jgi:excinuclease ABC subunit C
MTKISMEILDKIPSKTGVYLMRDEGETVIYVGKAKNLRSRVRSYFIKQENARPAIHYLVKRTAQIETILTDTEKEALILEKTLIKRHRPRYNISFRDDKSYFNLKLDIESPYPRLALVRKVRRDRALYFGPYASSQAVKETLKTLQSHFPLRTCRDSQFSHRSRPCLNFEIGRCSAPCTDQIDNHEYRRLVDGTILFMKGKKRELVANLRKRMKEASDDLVFEEAARIRDRIAAIEKTIEGQKVVSYRWGNADIHAWHTETGRMTVEVLHIREGKLIDARTFNFSIKSHSPEEAFSSFFTQFYDEGRGIPDEILVPHELEEMDVVKGWLSEERGKGVRIRVPRRGEGKRLLEMAAENATSAFRDEMKREEEQLEVLNGLKNKLGLKVIPRIMECTDISNIGGKEAVGSVVRLEDGKLQKEGYRKYKIRTVEGADDYAMMYETLKRHLRRNKDSHNLPDLMVVDGGKGQLGVAVEVLRELQIKETGVISLAKPRIEKGREDERSQDRVYTPRLKEPLVLQKGSPELLLLQRIRDEAHRFGVTYHKGLRAKKGARSRLDNIPGVGKARKEALLRHFGSMRAIQEATVEALMEVPKIPKDLGVRIHQEISSPGDKAR